MYNIVLVSVYSRVIHLYVYSYKSLITLTGLDKSTNQRPCPAIIIQLFCPPPPCLPKLLSRIIKVFFSKKAYRKNLTPCIVVSLVHILLILNFKMTSLKRKHFSVTAKHSTTPVSVCNIQNPVCIFLSHLFQLFSLPSFSVNF